MLRVERTVESESPGNLPLELGHALAQQIGLDCPHQGVDEVVDLRRLLRRPQPDGLGDVLVLAAREGQSIVGSGLALDSQSLPCPAKPTGCPSIQLNDVCQFMCKQSLTSTRFR